MLTGSAAWPCFRPLPPIHGSGKRPGVVCNMSIASAVVRSLACLTDPAGEDERRGHRDDVRHPGRA